MSDEQLAPVESDGDKIKRLEDLILIQRGQLEYAARLVEQRAQFWTLATMLVLAMDQAATVCITSPTMAEEILLAALARCSQAGFSPTGTGGPKPIDVKALPAAEVPT